MKRIGLSHFLTLLGLLILVGCNTGSMNVTSYDGKTGEYATTHYSKYYDAGDWLLKDQVGVSFIVEHNKKVIPVLHAIQTFLGALGPGDLYAKGDVTVCLWNLSEKTHEVSIKKITSGTNNLPIKGRLMTLRSKDRIVGEAGALPIFNYETEITVDIHYEVDGSEGDLTLNCARRTYEELNKYFGPKGTPPYPWFNGTKEK